MPIARSGYRADNGIARPLVQFRQCPRTPVECVEVAPGRGEFPFEAGYAVVVIRDRREMGVVQLSGEPGPERGVRPSRLELRVSGAHDAECLALAFAHGGRVGV